jgi:site-specific DNA recombinase
MGGGGKNGILRNQLYIGVLVYNRHRTVRNPDTGAVVPRRNPDADHIVKDVPHLRILDQGLWDAAQALRSERCIQKFGTAGLIVKGLGRRRTHLLAGLLRCGQCQGHMIFSSTSRGRQFVTCASAKVKSACTHRKAYDAEKLKRLVVENLRSHLIDPRRHAEAMKAATEEYAELSKSNSTEKIAAEKQIGRLTVQIVRLVDAIENSDQPIRELVASLEAKEAERVGLIERVRLLQSTNVVSLHPQVIDTYRQNVEQLHRALTNDSVDPEVVTAFRNLLECIVVEPTEYRKPYVVRAYGRLSAIMGVTLFPTARSGEEIVADEGLSAAAIASNKTGQVQRGNTCQ